MAAVPRETPHSQRELWAGVDAYADEVADMLKAVVRAARDAKKQGQLVEQLLPQAVADARHLHRECAAFAEAVLPQVLEPAPAAEAHADTLLGGAAALRSWLELLLIQFKAGQRRAAIASCCSNAPDRILHCKALRDAAAALAASTGLRRPSDEEEEEAENDGDDAFATGSEADDDDDDAGSLDQFIE